MLTRRELSRLSPPVLRRPAKGWAPSSPIGGKTEGYKTDKYVCTNQSHADEVPTHIGIGR